ncbi:hypothetical protein EELLY_v1c05780 [Entomoplasma ellychniae]|uniref:Uncharacterized protein n=2 Tax=Entomoplasmataceae TaxID=33925 RepID=A0A2S5RGV6_9MOLU|nr:hypothetical protein [Mesoplasma corruscae]PPE04897.1 hypothetical protein EELLY_v1c05780 [Entomoplasma ellychniae]PPE06564.1 hypothetical protein MCORR_v1c01950 [Mesoplasma corruscae]
MNNVLDLNNYEFFNGIDPNNSLIQTDIESFWISLKCTVICNIPRESEKSE